jgi:hypothetical protein
MKLCVLMSVVLGCGAAFAEGEHLKIKVSDAESSLLKGPIKWVEEERCRNVSGEFTKIREEYDPAGNLLVEVNWDAEGELTNTMTNYYDEGGTLFRQLYIQHGKKGFTNDWEIVLSPETRQIAKKRSNGSIVLRSYSPERRLVEESSMKSGKELRYIRKTAWNDFGQFTKLARLNAQKRPDYTYTYRWNGQGEIEKSHVIYHETKNEYLHEYEYLDFDDYGNWTQRLMVRYKLNGKNREKVYGRIQVRSFAYYDEEAASVTAEAVPSEVVTDEVAVDEAVAGEV